MKNIIYEWQCCYTDEDTVHSDFFKTIKECVEQYSMWNGKRLNFKDLLDDKTIDNELEDRQFAFVNNYKLDEYFDEGRKVPQKYIKEFNSNI